MQRLAIMDKDTGEVIEDKILIIGNKAYTTDRNFVKLFVAFLSDVITDKEIAGGPIRLLLYMIENMSYNDLIVYITPKKVLEDLSITKQTYHTWKNRLVEKGYIEQINPYVYRIKEYTAIKGNMKDTMRLT